MIFAFAKAQGINKIYAPGKVMIMNYALCIVHLVFKAWLPVVGHHCQQKLAVCLGADRLFAFASVSPDGFRQGMRSAQRVKSQG